MCLTSACIVATRQPCSRLIKIILYMKIVHNYVTITMWCEVYNTPYTTLHHTGWFPMDTDLPASC